MPHAQTADGAPDTDEVVRAAGFWLGVVLPVVYLPLLFVSIEALLALLPVHVVALAVGYDYTP